ncbi:MAG: DUF2326 domain-containing protein [Candidatus Paceibacteria bacterium]
MKLIKLVLEIDGKVVREVKFRDNLNIIISKKNVDTAGNSVGKSTLGRILDYLFDGSISPIYIDEEFQTPNSQIESLFKNKIVYVILEYIGLTNISSTIKRRLSPETELQDYYLDAKEVPKKEYISHIMKTIFNVSSEKPTIRKLAPKFFRTNSHRMLHTVKFDNGRNISKSDISTVFLYLFNFSNTEILTKRAKLNTAINRYSKQLKAFNGVIAEQKMIGSISKIKKEIDKLEKSIHSTDKDIDKIELVKNINEIDDEQNSLSDKILVLDLKIKNIIMTKEILTSDNQIYLIDELNSIYNYASINIESVLNDYKESLTFHNQLLSTKKEFILDGLEELKRERLNCNEKAIKLKRIKDNLYLELKSKKKIEELSDTVRQIGDLNKELIRFSSVIEEKDTIQSKKDDKDSELEKLSNELKKELINVDKFEKKLVKNFKNYTKEFYNVEYNFSLNLDKDKSECTPSVDEIESNNEGGLKRLEVILFDLSYIKTVNEENVNRVNFVLHDSIDDIDIEHIKKIFLESSKLSGQHILSMLSDKLTAEQYNQYKKYIILELSEDDKFFTV